MEDNHSTWIRLTLLGALAGVLSGGVVLAFREAIAFGQDWLLPPGNHEALSPWLRLAMPIGVGLLLGLLFDLLPRPWRDIGVVHVLKRLQGATPPRLPAINLLVQFCGAVVAIVGGHAVDREGPAAHIGAASASLIARPLGTEEDITLVACGAAAAIAAAFDTPLAGVVFVVEVLRIRYHVSRFVPVIVAAVVASMMSRALDLTEPGFSVSPEYVGSSWEFGGLAVLGLLVGLLAVLLTRLVRTMAEATLSWRLSTCFALAGLITGVLALGLPQIMGTSYNTLGKLLAGQGDFWLALGLVLAKLVATGCAIGLRVPGGIIGPTLFIGGAAGAALGFALILVSPVMTASPAFYATIGMVAMMGATLRAPLAALIALLELTGNPNIILPGMVAVACAELVSRLRRGERSVFDVIADVQARAFTIARPARGE
ncbi:MAG: chloride channel protein [Chromatiaceae bacterium]|nr:MAG: chloride channel protein [Chromatiaceae bacterium]